MSRYNSADLCSKKKKQDDQLQVLDIFSEAISHVVSEFSVPLSSPHWRFVIPRYLPTLGT